MTVVRMHTCLSERGGATRVARLLHDGLLARGAACTLEFEFDESAGNRSRDPKQASHELGAGEILHLHASSDWSALLAALPDGLRLAVTLHDVGLLSGGCAYHLECPGIFEGCPEPCPRGFEGSAQRRTLQARHLERLRPLLLAPSRWLAQLARRVLPGLDVRVIPNGVPWPLQTLTRAEARKALGIHPAARVLLFAAHGGTAAAYKNGPRWRTIWEKVKRRVPAALGFAVGGDQAGREGDLAVWPYVDRERLGLIMRAADLFLHPTRMDNHPLVLLEAAARRLACVSYAVGGVPEIVRHGETGLLAAAGREAELVDMAVCLLNNASLARDLGERAHDLGRERFAAERMVEDHRKAYAALQ